MKFNNILTFNVIAFFTNNPPTTYHNVKQGELDNLAYSLKDKFGKDMRYANVYYSDTRQYAGRYYPPWYDNTINKH